MRYRAVIAYDGGELHGWQVQPGGVATVEGELTRALATVSGVVSKVQGASRTDAGVHAEGQVCHFDYAGRMDGRQLLKGLNALIPRSVRVMHCEAVGDTFHARHDARGKLYRYDLWTDLVHHPLYRGTTLHVRPRLDLGAMRVASQALLGRHDFSALRAASCDASTPFVELWRVDVMGEAPLVQIWVEGAAFLKYMVRTLVGTLLDVGRGKRAADSLAAVLESRDRTQAGETVSAKGLRLLYVRYPEQRWSTGEAAWGSGF